MSRTPGQALEDIFLKSQQEFDFLKVNNNDECLCLVIHTIVLYQISVIFESSFFDSQDN